MTLHIADEDIGGARVRRLFQDGKYRSGMMLTADEVRSFGNRKALAEQGYIELWPAPRAPDVNKLPKHIISRGGGKFDVYAGMRLNEHGLSREEAEELATRPD